MAFIAYSAKNCKVRFGANTITVRGWNVDPKVDRQDSSNSEGGGYKHGEFCLAECNVSIDLHDNGLGNLYDLSIKPGVRFANVLLYLNDTAGPKWNFAYFDVLTVPMKANVTDLMGLTITGVAYGSWTYPTGNATS